MPVADRDEGSQRPAPVRRRVPPGRPPVWRDDRSAGPRRPAPPPSSRSASPAPLPERPPPGPGCALDDLYRLPMPKLFSLAEQEGINEHTGMNRGQLIVGVVRRQIERGEVVRGSGTLEVLPDGYGFLRSAGPQLPRLARKTSTSRRARSAAWACGPAWSSRGRSACRSRARTTSP